MTDVVSDVASIQGDWTAHCTSLLDDGSTRYEFTVHLRIVDGDDGPKVSMETAKSRSINQAVAVSGIAEGLLMVVSFVADPDHSATADHQFFGMVRYIFSPDHASGTGHFLNYNGRYTHGVLSLTRGAPGVLAMPQYSQAM